MSIQWRDQGRTGGLAAGDTGPSRIAPLVVSGDGVNVPNVMDSAELRGTVTADGVIGANVIGQEVAARVVNVSENLVVGGGPDGAE